MVTFSNHSIYVMFKGKPRWCWWWGQWAMALKRGGGRSRKPSVGWGVFLSHLCSHWSGAYNGRSACGWVRVCVNAACACLCSRTYTGKIRRRGATTCTTTETRHGCRNFLSARLTLDSGCRKISPVRMVSTNPCRWATNPVFLFDSNPLAE